MIRYSDTVRNTNGAPVVGALVAVMNQDGSATTLKDDAGLALPNPIPTDNYGGFYFNVDTAAFYDLRFFFGGRLVSAENNVRIGIQTNTQDTINLPSLGNLTSTTPRLDITQDSTNTVVGANTTFRLTSNKRAGGPGTWMTGDSGYTYDYVGWDGTGDNTFVEGGRREAIGYGDRTSPYGFVGVATTGTGVRYTYLIGMEGTTNNYYADAPDPISFSPNNFSAAVVATNGITNFGVHKKSDAAFLSNRYSKAPFRTGLLIDNGSVDHTGIRVGGPMVIGMDLSGCGASYAGLILGDNAASTIRMGSALGNMLSTQGTRLAIGSEASQIGFHGFPPISPPVLSAAATDAATTMALVNQLRSTLITYGLCQ